MKQTNETRLRCRCGQVEFSLEGKPIMAVVCHCDDCQRASAELEKLPGALPILDEAFGTPYVMHRRSGVTLVQGQSLLTDHRIEGEAFVKRVVASCCQTPLYLDFEKGHWLSFFGARFDPAPKPLWRTQTRFVPAGTKLPPGTPYSRTYPLGFIARLIGASFGNRKQPH